MKQLEWLSDAEFTVGGVKFRCEQADYSLKNDAARCVLLKTRDSLERYAEALADAPLRNVLEFGIFRGGSPALFAAWLDLDKLVGVDICDPVESFDAFCRTHEIGRKIRTYYRVSQTDRPRMDEIVGAEFGAAPLEIVGARNANLAGLASLFASSLYDQASGALRRARRHIARNSVDA